MPSGRCITATVDAAKAALAGLADLVPDLEALYKDIHEHPELSLREPRTAGIGKTGVETLIVVAMAWLAA